MRASCQRRFERGPNVAVRRGTSIFFPTSEERGVLPVGFGLLPPGTVLPDSGLGLRGAGEAVTRAGNAPRRQPQVPLLYRGLYSGSPEPISSAILPEAGVPDGEQTSESAELAGQIELHARQCKRGRPSAGVAAGKSGVLEGAAEEVWCLTRELDRATTCEPRGYSARHLAGLTRDLEYARPSDGGAYRSSHRVVLRRGHSRRGQSTISSRTSPVGRNHENQC